MKTGLVITMFFLLGGRLFAQNTSIEKVKPPILFREVSGTVRDFANNAMTGASVTLLSAKDTLKSATNSKGQFIFRKVQSGTFVIKVAELGFDELIGKYFYTEGAKAIQLEPITLKQQLQMLKEVAINGTPSIVYKMDTVEYYAQDYKVRVYATVDEMLKKMEGTEVSPDGKLTYNGRPVVQAKLNGKSFAGGDVAQAIKNLPADIVEKVQIVNTYGDEADRTGIKTGQPVQILNITTKPDRSIGDIIRITPAAGNNDRYNTGLFAQYINANQEIGVIGNLNSIQNGVASGGVRTAKAAAGGGGTIKTVGVSVYYNDQWGKQIDVNTSYSYNKQINATNSSSSGQQLGTLGTSYFNNESNSEGHSENHALNFELNYAITNNDFLRVAPSFTYSRLNSESNALQLLTGLIHQTQNGIEKSSNTNPDLEGKIFYQHKFKYPVRNFTIQLNIGRINTDNSNGSDKTIRYYKDESDTVLKDSLQNYLAIRQNLSKSYETVITYIEPVGIFSQVEFRAKTTFETHNNFAGIDSLSDTGVITPLTGLTNKYRYSTTTSHIGLDFHFDEIKYNASIGVAVVPLVLNGNSFNLNAAKTHYSYINIVPIFRLQLSGLSVEYIDNHIEPGFTQLQPFTDKSDPQNIVVGNPKLKPSFMHTVSMGYNKYISLSGVNVSANISARIFNDPVITNTIQVFQPLVHSYINEIHYLNGGNRYSFNGGYTVSKAMDHRKYNFSLSALSGYQRYTAMSNGVVNFNNSWHFNQKIAVRTNPNEWLEINPNISYDINRTRFGLNNKVTNIKTTTLAVDGKTYFFKTWLSGYSVNKNYIDGISADITRNPLVIDAYVEKAFLKRKNLVLNVKLFDLLHQNNYLNQVITSNAIINTKTNDLSRYVMVSLRLILQKWEGTPKRDGTILQRRGDGSFIY